MKKGLLTRAILSLTLLLTGSTASYAQTKSEITAAHQKAENVQYITFSDPRIPLEQYSYLVPNKDVYVIKGVKGNGRNTSIFFPGMRNFDVTVHENYPITQEYGSRTFINASGLTLYVRTNCEAGKYYTFEYERIKNGRWKNDSISVSIIEVTDENILNRGRNDISAIKEYLAWSQANPGALEGTYYTENRKGHITFSGNTFDVTYPIAGTPCRYQGTYWFNENTIILNPEFLTTGKQKQKPYYGGIEIWYYKLNDGGLEMIDRNRVGLIANIKDKYYKNTK